MPIDPHKQRKILVVHGVETGDDSDLHQGRLWTAGSGTVVL